MDRPRPLASRFLALAARLVADRRGATALEYGLIIALLVIVMIGGLSAAANSTVSMWTNTSAKVAAAK